MATRYGLFPIFAVLIEFLASVFAFPASEAQAGALGNWYDMGWVYRKKITIVYTNVSATLTNFTLLVSVTDTNLINTANGGHVAQSDGGDIIFANPQLTKLDHELEKYVDTNGQLIAWVRIPILSSNVTPYIYMYYGGKDPSNQWNKTNTWETNAVMVQHLAETAGGKHYDSTANANTGTVYGAIMGVETGKIDGADSFDGVNDYVNAGDGASLNTITTLTLSAWVKSSDYSSYRDIVIKGQTSYNGSYILRQTWGGNGSSEFKLGSTGIGYQNPSVVWNGTWQFIVGVWSGTQLSFYFNGVSVSTPVNYAGPIPTNSSPLYIGYCPNRGTYFHGSVDEVRVYNRAWSAGEILTQYRNQSSPSTFYNVGLEENAPRITLINIS